jgi:hypothetical protein
MDTPNLPALIERLADAPQPGQWTEFERLRQVAFLEALATGGSVRSAARAADVSSQTAYRARRADAVFRLAWQGALLAARARAEDTLACRAIDGIEQEVLYHGEVVATRRRYSDRLLLAHLARLDRLTEDGRTNAFAEDFEAALARFAAGEPQPEPQSDPTARPAPAPTPEVGPRAGAENFSSGECNIRSKSNSDAGAESGEEELEQCPITGAMLLPDECLRNLMEAERPAGAPTPRQLAGRFTAEEIADEQLAAYEECVDRWWLVVPPAPADDPEEWAFAPE